MWREKQINLVDEYKDKIDLREQPNAMKLYLNLNYLKEEQDLQYKLYEQIKKDNLKEDNYSRN